MTGASARSVGTTPGTATAAVVGLARSVAAGAAVLLRSPSRVSSFRTVPNTAGVRPPVSGPRREDRELDHHHHRVAPAWGPGRAGRATRAPSPSAPWAPTRSSSTVPARSAPRSSSSPAASASSSAWQAYPTLKRYGWSFFTESRGSPTRTSSASPRSSRHGLGRAGRDGLRLPARAAHRPLHQRVRAGEDQGHAGLDGRPDGRRAVDRLRPLGLLPDHAARRRPGALAAADFGWIPLFDVRAPTPTPRCPTPPATSPARSAPASRSR